MTIRKALARSVALAGIVLAGSTALPGPASAQIYMTPDDHLAIERRLGRDLARCIDDGRGSYEGVLACGRSVADTCYAMSPHGETTAGFAICGQITAGLLDAEMNRVWSAIKAEFPPDAFARRLEEQRAWLKFRESEFWAARERYRGGSMSQYSGWVEYNSLSVDRLARLHEIAGDR
ncbi:lysozyme inhibitor LprI family protein [uncultured Paracoccus sp.]|uniref:lysozyme inhibitor LprI family protein n=1 Tax=uncultured Paracoccus sp. TaxID=189685 RepID=UPI0026281079|nr:lysozyme inhibitor LprI family protein [uncultured Paracoccus sp.]